MKPPFLSGSSGSSSSSSAERFDSPAQKSGGMEPGEGGQIPHFENRPQKSGGMDSDSKSIPPGGNGHPLGAPKNPSLPAKLGK